MCTPLGVSLWVSQKRFVPVSFSWRSSVLWQRHRSPRYSPGPQLPPPPALEMSPEISFISFLLTVTSPYQLNFFKGVSWGLILEDFWKLKNLFPLDQMPVGNFNEHFPLLRPSSFYLLPCLPFIILSPNSAPSLFAPSAGLQGLCFPGWPLKPFRMLLLCFPP